MFKKKLLVFFLIFFSLSAFPPQSEKIFIQNCLRLLNNSQYSFLTDYFSKYYPNFNNSRKFDYVEKLITSIPFLEQKIKVSEIYLKNSKKINNEIYFLAGQLALFKKEEAKAINYFKKFKGRFHLFYLGLAYKANGNFVDAEKLFLQNLKNNSILNEQVYILLAEIYLKWGDKKKATQQINKIKNLEVKNSFLKELKKL